MNEVKEIATTYVEPNDTISFQALCECGGVFHSLDDTYPRVLYCRECETAVRYDVTYERLSEKEIHAEKQSYAGWMEYVVQQLKDKVDETFIPDDAFEDVDEWR